LAIDVLIEHGGLSLLNDLPSAPDVHAQPNGAPHQKKLG
jgi:hypothetical protein